MQKGQQINGEVGTDIPKEIELAVVGGLSPGAKLREPRMFRLGALGVQFAGEMSFEHWQEGMAMLGMWKHASQLWLTDFITKGRSLFGDEKVQETLAQLQFDLHDTTQALAIGELSLLARRPGLTNGHYLALADARLSAEVQEQWADLALKHNMTAAQLEKSIAAGAVLPERESASRSAGGGIATIHGFRQVFDLWFRKVDQSDEPIDQWSSDRKRELWEELKGPVKVGLDLARSLGIDVEKEVRS